MHWKYDLAVKFVFLISEVFLFLTPEQASNHNDVGEYDLAKRYGSIACKCNLCSILPSVITAIIVLIIFLLLATGVIGVASSASDTIQQSAEDTNS